MSRPGQVVVEKIQIQDFNKTRSFNITDDLVSLKIHEDVFKNTMYGHIVFLDKMNALEELPILGEEYLSIKFHLPFDSSKKREFEFFIYAIEGLSFDDSQRYTIVTLKFISVEQITNAKRLISYGFRDGKVSDYVKKVLEEQLFLNTKKKIKLEDTTEIKTLGLPYLTPFEMIEFFRKNAFSSNTKTSSYLFFENAEGFNFYTLEGLIKENKRDPIKLYYQPTQDKKDEEDLLYKTRTVTNISYVSLNDTLESMRRGTYNTKMMFFDFNTKVFNTEQFKILDEFANFEHLDSNSGLKNTDDFLRSIAPDASEHYVYNKSYFLPDDSSRDNNTSLLSVKEMAKHFTYMEMLQQTPMLCSIYGDATIKAGDVVNIQIPQPTAAESSTGREFQKYLNGNYFVGRVNHVIEGGDYYKMQLNLYKESYASKIVKQNPFYTNGNASIVETVVRGGGAAP